MNKLDMIRKQLEELKKMREDVVKESMNGFDYEHSEVNDASSMNVSSSKTEERGKRLSLNNGHSILSDKNSNSGFVSVLIFALLCGFGVGSILTALYIFINLGKFTFVL